MIQKINIINELIFFIKSISLLFLISLYLRRNKRENGVKIFNQETLVVLYIWVTSYVADYILLSNILALRYVYFIKIFITITYYILLFYSFSFYYIYKEEGKNNESKNELRVEEENKYNIIKENTKKETINEFSSDIQIEKDTVDIKSIKYDKNFNLPKVIQSFYFEPLKVFPKKTVNNNEFHSELRILHPLVEEIYPLASKIRPFIPMDIEKDNELFNDINKLTYLGIPNNTDYPKNPLIRLLRGVIKGIHGEDLLKKELGINFKNSFVKHNMTVSDGKDKAELDSIMIIGNNILTFESKSYSADKITFSKAGQAVVEKYNNKRIIDAIGQMNRHYRILKNIFKDKDINIYNFFVMTDKKTPIVNNFKNQYFKIAYVNGLSYKIRDLDLLKNEDKESEIIDILNSNQSPALTFETVNLKLIQKWLLLSAENGIDEASTNQLIERFKTFNTFKSNKNAENLNYNINIYKEMQERIIKYYKKESL